MFVVPEKVGNVTKFESVQYVPICIPILSSGKLSSYSNDIDYLSLKLDRDKDIIMLLMLMCWEMNQYSCQTCEKNQASKKYDARTS